MKGVILDSRVFPDENRRLRCDVLIFEYKKDFLSFCKEIRLPSDRKQEALCATWLDSCRLDFGVMLFHRKQLGAEILAHETGHAAFGYLRRKKIDPYKNGTMGFVSDAEEIFCYAHGRMLEQLAILVNQLEGGEDMLQALNKCEHYEKALERILALDSRKNPELGQFCDTAIEAIGIAWEALRKASDED